MKNLGDVRLIKSYVWHGEKCYFVSTIDRDSSAMQGGRFSETMVWDYDWDKGERGKHILCEGSSFETHIGQHLKLCQRIFETGICEIPEAT